MVAVGGRVTPLPPAQIPACAANAYRAGLGPLSSREALRATIVGNWEEASEESRFSKSKKLPEHHPFE